jgi:hypothetical protein
MMSVAGDIGVDQFGLCDAECALAVLSRYEVRVKLTGHILVYTPKYLPNLRQIRSVRTQTSRYELLVMQYRCAPTTPHPYFLPPV